ncbi:metallophosphoesterase [Methylobacterium sp. D54C]
MRIWILSDLHRDVGFPRFRPPSIPDADVAVVAGDVGENLAASVAWVAEVIGRHMPAVMVAGNHEFYGGTIPSHLDRGRAAAAGTDVHLLENGTVTLAGIRFSGCTFWTDYDLEGPGTDGPAMEAARRCLLDHRRIGVREDDRYRTFQPEDALRLHLASRVFFEGALFRNHTDAPRQVVVTHHAPTPMSIHPRYTGDPLNPAFVSDLTDLVAAAQPALWVHGHVHSSFDYRVAATRVVCNPKGYGRENPDFDPGLVIEI